jgi:hypothetical protein
MSSDAVKALKLQYSHMPRPASASASAAHGWCT